MSEYVTHRSALSGARLESLRDALLSSRFVARSPLMGTFQSSRGFAFIFTEAGRVTLEERFPFLLYLSVPEGAKGGTRCGPSREGPRLPAFRIQSKAGFAAYLEEHRQRPHSPR